VEDFVQADAEPSIRLDEVPAKKRCNADDVFIRNAEKRCNADKVVIRLSAFVGTPLRLCVANDFVQTKSSAFF
jgi:hypothetical protein